MTDIIIKTVKGNYFLVLSIIIIIVAQNVSCNYCCISNSKTIFVDADNLSGIYDGTVEHPFRTISDALLYVEENDTIFVFSGLYPEKIIIKKPLALIGENKKSTILDGRYDGTVINVYANNVKITGITVKNSGPGLNYDSCGIYVYADNVVIYDTIITKNYNGIHIDYSFESTSIYNNQINNNVLDGLKITYCYKFSIYNNEISENGKDGCYVSNSVKGDIHKNIIEFNEKSGIAFWESTYNEFYDNYLEGNNKYGVFLNLSHNNNIFSNTIKECYRGIYLYGSGRNNIDENNFLENSIEQAFFNTFISIFPIDEFFSCGRNTWEKNYWDNCNGNKIYIIDGVINFFSISISFKNFDRSPASKPYDNGE